MLHEAAINSLKQVLDILEEVQNLPEDKALEFYSGTNAGKHVRHVIDHFLAFLSISEDSILDYNTRNRDSVVETDWNAAKQQVTKVIQDFQNLPIEEKPLRVISEIDVSDTQNHAFNSNSPREILYLINHTMHHAAYINLLAKTCGVALPDHIGVAPSTASHLRNVGG